MSGHGHATRDSLERCRTQLESVELEQIAEPEPRVAVPAPTRDRPASAERAAAFLLPAGAIVALALEGGSFDVVVRGEWGLASWWVLMLGIGLGLLPRAGLGLPAAGGLLAFAGLFALTALALIWTESDERTSLETARVAMHAGVFALAICMLRRSTWSAAVAGLAVGAAIVSVLAVSSRLFPSGFPSDLVAAEFSTTRLSYPLNYWNAVGAWCAVTVALSLAFSAHSAHRAWRAAALAVAPVAATGAYLTYSRASVGGVVIAVGCVFVLARHRWVVVLHALAAGGATALTILAVRSAPDIANGTGGAEGLKVAAVLATGAAVCGVVAALTPPLDGRLRLPRRLSRVALVVVAVSAVLAAVVVGPGVADRAWDQFTTQDFGQASADPAARLGTLAGNRYNVWDAALDIGRAHPWNGVGPGAYELAWNRDGRDSEHVRDAHSLWLEAWAELGLPGVIVTLALAVTLLGAGLLARRSAERHDVAAGVAVPAALVVTGFHASFDWIWESTANASLAIALAGAAVAGSSRPRIRIGLRWRVPLALVAAVLVLVQLPPTVGTSRIRDSQAAAAREDDGEAFVAAEEAVAVQPWAASPYVQRALLNERAGALRAAEVDLRRAQEREGTDWRHPLLLARVLAERGEAREAIEAFRRARELRPQSRRLRPAVDPGG